MKTQSDPLLNKLPPPAPLDVGWFEKHLKRPVGQSVSVDFDNVKALALHPGGIKIALKHAAQCYQSVHGPDRRLYRQLASELSGWITRAVHYTDQMDIRIQNAKPFLHDRDADQQDWTTWALVNFAMLLGSCVSLVVLSIISLQSTLMESGLEIFENSVLRSLAYSAIPIAMTMAIKGAFGLCRTEASRNRWHWVLYMGSIAIGLLFVVCFVFNFGDGMSASTGNGEVWDDAASDEGSSSTALLLVLCSVTAEIGLSAALWLSADNVRRAHVNMTPNPELETDVANKTSVETQIPKANSLLASFVGLVDQIDAGLKMLMQKTRDAINFYARIGIDPPNHDHSHGDDHDDLTENTDCTDNDTDDIDVDDTGHDE